MFKLEIPQSDKCGVVDSIKATAYGTSWITLFSPIENHPIKHILFFADELMPDEFVGELASVETVVSREGRSRIVTQCFEAPQSRTEVQLPFYNYRQLLVRAAMDYRLP